jgi:hypothetical protein
VQKFGRQTYGPGLRRVKRVEQQVFPSDQQSGGYENSDDTRRLQVHCFNAEHVAEQDVI